MANYGAKARSNYFKVKDAKAFEAWIETRELTMMVNDDDKSLFGIYSATESGSWPTSYYDDGKEEDINIDLITEICEHLADGQVAILFEIGSERMRFLSGETHAFNNKGKKVSIFLSDIYEKALKKFHTKPTVAEY